MKIAVLISGGVDSAVVVHRLKEEGHDLHLFYIRIGLDNGEGEQMTSIHIISINEVSLSILSIEGNV